LIYFCLELCGLISSCVILKLGHQLLYILLLLYRIFLRLKDSVPGHIKNAGCKEIIHILQESCLLPTKNNLG